MPRRHPQGADQRWRYLVSFSDGGAAPRFFDVPLEVGGVLRDCGSLYRIVAVQHPRQVGVGGGTAHAVLLD